jgi:rhodanese-related sulfurtransferase
MSDVATISAQQLASLQQQAPLELIDVRTPAEFRQVHAQPARNLPLDQLDPQAVMTSRNGSTDAPLYVICQSGSRGAKACQKFLHAGYSNVVNVEGGTKAWESAGLPVVRGKKSISLERQVRIVAGAIVLTGALLAVTVNAYFALISAFVGAGLMFAGITDTCGMAMMLAKMPWNQVREQPSEPMSNSSGSCPTP